MQKFGKGRNMYEVRRMYFDDIAPLLKSIEGDISLKNWTEAEFIKTLENEDRIIYIIEDFAFLEISNNYDEAEIYMIWVAPTKRGNGFGQKILQYMLEEITEMKIAKIFLEVAINNNKAIELYKKNGFENCGIRKNYYKLQNDNYLDAFVMVKQICKKA